MSSWINESWNGEFWGRSRLGVWDGEIEINGSILDKLLKCFIRYFSGDAKSTVRSSGAVEAGDLEGIIFKAIRLCKILYEDKRAENQALRPPVLSGQEEKKPRHDSEKEKPGRYGENQMHEVSQSKWRKFVIPHLLPLQLLILKESFKQWLHYFSSKTYHFQTYWEDIYYD